MINARLVLQLFECDRAPVGAKTAFMIMRRLAWSRVHNDLAARASHLLALFDNKVGKNKACK